MGVQLSMNTPSEQRDLPMCKLMMFSIYRENKITATSHSLIHPLNHLISTTLRHPKTGQFIEWKLPIEGSIKINFDGSKSLTGATTRFVIRRWQGNFIMAGSHFLEQVLILVVEATTKRNGVKIAVQGDYYGIQVEGDNQIIAKAMRTHINTSWYIAPIP